MWPEFLSTKSSPLSITNQRQMHLSSEHGRAGGLSGFCRHSPGLLVRSAPPLQAPIPGRLNCLLVGMNQSLAFKSLQKVNSTWLDQTGLHLDLASSSHNEMQQVLSVRAFHKLFFLSSIWHLAQLNLKVQRRAKGLCALEELNRSPLRAIWFGRKKAATWNHLRNWVFLLADNSSSWKEGDDPIHRTVRNTLPIGTSRAE